MVIDFSTTDLREAPVLVLRNLDETAIQVLGYAFGLRAELNYNEISTIEFSIPEHVDSAKTQGYELVSGKRIVDLLGWGQFYLVDPEITNDGVREIKQCKAYSLEYEFTKKKISLPEGTYEFWNPAAGTESILSIILEYMPSWSVGEVDPVLIGKYRTFDVSDSNIYDFIKSTLQDSYSCIFEFDTYRRRVNVKHVDTDATQSAVYLSLDNLAKEIKISEDSDNIYTVLDVNGAEDVDIRSVNPIGTNKIYNLDYFMNTGHFSQEMIDKWTAWKTTLANYRETYYIKTIERELKISEIALAQAKVDEKRDIELANLYNIQSTYIELATSLGSREFYVGLSGASNGRSEVSGGGYQRIKVTAWYINNGDTYADNSAAITFPTATSDWFKTTGSGNQQVVPTIYWNLYIDTDSQHPIAYGSMGQGQILSGGTYSIPAHTVQAVFANLNISDADAKQNAIDSFHALNKLDTYRVQIDSKEAEIASDEADIQTLEAERDALRADLTAINQACAFSSFFTSAELLILDRYFIEDSISESSFVLAPASTYTNADVYEGGGQDEFVFEDGAVTQTDIATGHLILKIAGGTLEVDGVLSSEAGVISAVIEINGTSAVLTALLSGNGDYNGATITASGTLNGYTASDTDVDIQFTSDDIYVTWNNSTYAQRSVEFDLYDYGMDVLQKLAWPSYTFDVSSANFFALDDFKSFVDSIGLGKRIYLDDGKSTKTPIVTGVSVDFDNLESFTLQFSSTYNLSDPSFHLVDLLEKSVSMGKTVDMSKFSYNAFIDSGANTAVKQFMDSSLDVAKNSIISSSGQEIIWNGSGIRCRKSNGNGGYYPEEIAIINNSIVFTDDQWRSAKMGIGKFNDPNLGTTWGIAAPSIVGTMIAGNNLIIESAKKDGTTAVFRVDGDGAVLYNSKFEIANAHRHIILDPEVGIAIGEYPVIDGNGDVDIGTVQDPGNAKFWVDANGNVYMRGTLEACDGTFTGSINWKHQGNTATIEFTNGSAGGSSITDLIQLDSSVGILINAGTNIRIHAGGTSWQDGDLWLQNLPTDIHILKPGSTAQSYSYCTLYEYVYYVIHGSYPSQ